MRISVCIPVYGHYDYALLAIRSCFEHTKDVMVFVIDDGTSPELIPAEIETMKAPEGCGLYFAKLLVNHGLTYAWNLGLQAAAAETPSEYHCCANSDLIFSPGWADRLIAALENGYSLVGPMTNAPGTEENQNINRLISTYDGKYSMANIRETSELLHDIHAGKVIESPINGFCMMAKTKTWWDNAYDASSVFKPVNEFNSKGQKNPTPLDSLQEYELQGRWKKAGLKTGICLDAFVYHFRSVTRGERFRMGQGDRI